MNKAFAAMLGALLLVTGVTLAQESRKPPAKSLARPPVSATPAGQAQPAVLTGQAARVAPVSPALMGQMQQKTRLFDDLRNRVGKAKKKPDSATLTYDQRARQRAGVPDSYTRKAAQGDDCDDMDRSVHRGAADVCDHKDNNCDGAIDEGQTLTFFLDADGDGHGSASQRVEACPFDQSRAASEGRWLVMVGNDCDDTNPAIWQGCP